MYDLRQVMIGFTVAVVIFLIAVFSGFGLIGGLIGFFIAGLVTSFLFKGTMKNGLVNGIIIGVFGWAIVYFVIINVMNVSTDIIGDFSLLIPQEDFLNETWVSFLYIVTAIAGGIIGSLRR
ncbi:MAG: DUF5518 domain-containing protein [Methanobacterium sp.]